MMQGEFWSADLSCVSSLVRRQVVSPVELVEGALERAAEFNPRLGLFLTILGDSALSRARRAEAEIANGHYRGFLHGVPLSVKDALSMKGVPMSAGSAALRNSRPTYDAGVVERLDLCGASIVAKAQMYELAMGPDTAYPFGKTRNPWDPTRVTVGSSSGSAAAVSSFTSYASIGTDAGGSIRGPASACGVVGFKPSFGRISRFGVLPLSWSLDHVGPITRTAWDCALVAAALEGRDTRDPMSADLPAIDLAVVGSAAIRGTRVGVPREFFVEHVDPEFISAFDRALELLVSAGAIPVKISMDRDLIERALVAQSHVVLFESRSIHGAWIASADHLVGPNIRERMRAARAVTARDYLHAMRARSLFQREFASAMQDVDVVMTLTSPSVPGRFDEALPNSDPFAAPHHAGNRFTRIFNLIGVPAISVPGGFTSSGMPIGIQFVGAYGEDAAVLRTATGFQRRSDWHSRVPAAVRNIQ